MNNFSLKSCFLFSPNLKPNKPKPSDLEIQDAKLLFYYPSSEDIVMKRSNVGIIEGTLNFMKTFDFNEDNEMLITELSSAYCIAHLFEKEYYLVLHLEKKHQFGFTRIDNIYNKKNWLKLLINNVYDLFYLFHGELHSYFFPDGKDIREDEHSYDKASIKLYAFVGDYLESLSKMSTPFIDSVVYGYNPSLSNSLLFATLKLNERIGQIEKISIAYKGRIIYNEMDVLTMNLLYNLFYSAIDVSKKYDKFNLPPFKEIQIDHNQNDNHGNPAITIVSHSDNNDGVGSFMKAFQVPINEDKGYLIGLKEVTQKNDEEKIEKCHVFIPTINIKESQQKYKLMVYNYKEMIVFLFMSQDFDDNDVFTIRRIAKFIHDYVGKDFQSIDIANNALANQTSTLQFSYFNSDNHSFESTLLNNINKSNNDNQAIIKIIFEMIHSTSTNDSESSVTKLKDNHLYFISFNEKKYVIILKEFISKDSIRIKYATEIENKFVFA